jgi:hypothetical protein
MQNFDVCTWPPQPLDLNSMKHVWALVKWKSNEYPTPTKGMLQVWSLCKLLSISSLLSNVKSSIIAPNCIQVVLTSKGRWTNYQPIGRCSSQN